MAVYHIVNEVVAKKKKFKKNKKKTRKRTRQPVFINTVKLKTPLF
jgi:hypothetical protein